MKKIIKILLFMIISLVATSIELTTDLATNYPYKDSPLKASIFGTPREDWYKIKKPRMPKKKHFEARRDVPEIFRRWKIFEYGVLNQKEEAPLIILISGTGGTYEGSYTLYLANVFYEKGYSVMMFGSVTTMPYMAGQSENIYAGYLSDESKIMYEIITDALKTEEAEGHSYTDRYISGYSLGGFQALQIHEIDSKEKVLEIDKSLILNSPISIFDAISRLDNFLIKNAIYDYESLEKYLDTVYSKVIRDKNIDFTKLNADNLSTILASLDINDSTLEVAIGLMFRMHLINFVFSGEVLNDGGDLLLESETAPKRYDSTTNYFLNGLSLTFEEYAKEVLNPYVNKKNGTDMSFNEFKKLFSLDNSREFINKYNNDIIFVTSADDFLIDKNDLDYIDKTFSNKVIIPYGGHTGVLWHKDIVEMLVKKLEN